MTNAALKKHIGRHLQAARKAAGFRSARAFAEHLGLEPTTYTSYEQGTRQFNTELAWDFAEALGISIDELVGHEAGREFADPAQAALNGYYESMNEAGRTVLVESARLMSDGNGVRIQKNGQDLRVPEEMDGVA